MLYLFTNEKHKHVMNNNLNPEYTPVFWALIVKFKGYAVGGVMSIVTAYSKYKADKRNPEVKKKKGFLAYLVVNSSVVFTILGIINYMGLEMNLITGMVLYWCGLSSDFLSDSFDKIIKAVANKNIKKYGGENEQE